MISPHVSSGNVMIPVRGQVQGIGYTLHFANIPGISRKISILVYFSSDRVEHAG
jgi:hypothetical protein